MLNPSMMQCRLFLLALLLLTLFSVTGCSTVPPPTPPLHRAEDYIKADVTYAVDVSDPLEWLNRRTYNFNYYFDKFVFLPVVKTYEFILPDYVEDRISNAVDNIFEVNNFTNNLLQLKFKRTGITLARVVVNTTVGIGGLWDPASGWGMKTQEEDFGQTLGFYGVGHGPYLVLPVMGPSNLRDTTGLVADSAVFSMAGPPAWMNEDGRYTDEIIMTFNAVSAVDKRHTESFRYYGTGSPFEYDMIRMLYTSKREIEIAK